MPQAKQCTDFKKTRESIEEDIENTGHLNSYTPNSTLNKFCLRRIFYYMYLAHIWHIHNDYFNIHALLVLQNFRKTFLKVTLTVIYFLVLWTSWILRHRGALGTEPFQWLLHICGINSPLISRAPNVDTFKTLVKIYLFIRFLMLVNKLLNKSFRTVVSRIQISIFTTSRGIRRLSKD